TLGGTALGSLSVEVTVISSTNGALPAALSRLTSAAFSIAASPVKSHVPGWPATCVPPVITASLGTLRIVAVSVSLGSLLGVTSSPSGIVWFSPPLTAAGCGKVGASAAAVTVTVKGSLAVAVVPLDSVAIAVAVRLKTPDVFVGPVN